MHIKTKMKTNHTTTN